jgi:hypothetical protein
MAFVNTATDKLSGPEPENVFARSGSATRIYELESIFDDTKHRYGKGLDWSGYDVYDAASCLLRYLKLLPGPVIPFDLYDQFTGAIEDELPPDYAFNQVLPDDFDTLKVIWKCQQAAFSLPPLNRHLLLYLLDLLAVFASNSDSNHMTPPCIVAAFQPAFLSRPPSEMSASDHLLAAETMIFMVKNQDHFMMGMRAGISKDEEPATTPVERTSKAPSAFHEVVRAFSELQHATN